MIEVINNNFHFFSGFISHDINLITNSFEYPFQGLLILKLIFLSIIPLVGIALLINIYFKIQNIYFSIFTTIILIVFILYLATHAGYYWEMKKIIFFLGYCSFAFNGVMQMYSVYRLINFKRNLFSFRDFFKDIPRLISILSSKIFELIILIIPFYFLLILQDLGMYGYDTFWHGMFSKHINHFGGFWDSESIILQSHMTTLPFFYLFQNWFLSQGVFIERVAVFANNFFAIIGVLALYAETKNKFSIRIIIFLSILILYSMFGHGAFMTLTVEHCLSITLAFYLYFIFKNSSISHFYILLATLPVTILMKENFIFLIPTICFLAVLMSMKKINLWNYFTLNRKYIYIFLVPLIVSIFIYLNYQSSFNFENVTRTPFDIFLKSEKLFYVSEVLPNLVEAVFTRNLIVQGDLNNYFYLFDTFSKNISWIFSAGSLLLLMNIFLFIIQKVEVKNRKFIYALNFGFLIYFLFLLTVFVFGMNQNEASSLSSYERYFSVFFFGNILCLLFLISDNLNFNNTLIRSRLFITIINYRRILFFTIIILIYFFNGLSSTRMFASINPDINFVKKEKDSLIQVKDLVKEIDSEKIYKNVAVVFNANVANIKWIILKYMLAPHHDVREIKLLSNKQDIIHTLQSSEILVLDNLDTEKQKILNEYFNDVDTLELNNIACFINSNDKKLELKCNFKK